MRLLLATIPLLTGCVAYTAATPATEPHFEHLRAGDLADFEQRIQADLQTGTVRDETRVGQAWMQFLTCTEIDVSEATAPEYSWALALLEYEESRRATYVISRRTEPAKMLDLAYAKMASDEVLNWEPTEAASAEIVWPAEDEDWADELAAADTIQPDCEELLSRLVDDETPAGFAGVQPFYERQFSALARANEAAQRAGRALDGPARDLDLNVNLYSFGVATQLAQLASERDGMSYGADLPDQVEDWLRGAVQRAEAGGQRKGPALAASHFVLAHRSLSRDEVDQAQKHLASAQAAGPDSTMTWPIRHLSLWLQWERGEWAAISEADDELPPLGFRNFGSYVFFRSSALLRNGEVDRFLAVVTTAMADRDWTNAPYLEATWGEVMRYLTTVSFDDRVVELVENLGPRPNTYERMEELGRTALDQGKPDVADDAATWLLARDSDARRHAKYYAIRAIADFLRDNPEGFRDELRQITKRDPNILDAIPKSRRAKFFEHADRELARILAQTMPMMAEWGDDPAARTSRRDWLKLLVEEIQLFLRNADETSARSQLIELYRLASELLSDHPRGYAERVGRENGDPILLGTVRVEAPPMGSDLQFTSGRYSFPRFFAPIPDDKPVGEWGTEWPVFEEDKE